MSPGLPHDGSTLREKSLGGSETAALHMARCLAAGGHRVTAFTPGHQGRVDDGVTFLPIEQAGPYCASVPHDVEIVSRLVDFLRVMTKTKLRFLWCHDLILKRNRQMLGGLLWTLDGVYVLSTYMRDQYRDVGAIPEAAFFVTRNGVDLRSFQGLETLPRDRHKLVYGSRPERGLENCLAIMAELGRRQSPLRLHVAWYENTPPQLEGYYKHLWAQAQQLPNVKLLGPLKQADWHRELATARALIYPGVASDFREISGIVFMEAEAAGTPVIACARGAIPETVPPQCGRLIGDESSDVHGKEYRQQFVAAVDEVATDDVLWRSMSFACRERASTLSWDSIAAEWEADWERRFRDATADRWRMRRQLERSGDRTEVLTAYTEACARADAATAAEAIRDIRDIREVQCG